MKQVPGCKKQWQPHLCGFGFGFLQRLYKLYVIQHVACRCRQLTEQRVFKIFQKFLILAGLLDETFSLFLQFLALEAHDDAEELVFKTLARIVRTQERPT